VKRKQEFEVLKEEVDELKGSNEALQEEVRELCSNDVIRLPP
jgi:hypothetical protein